MLPSYFDEQWVEEITGVSLRLVEKTIDRLSHNVESIEHWDESFRSFAILTAAKKLTTTGIELFKNTTNPCRRQLLVKAVITLLHPECVKAYIQATSVLGGLIDRSNSFRTTDKATGDRVPLADVLFNEMESMNEVRETVFHEALEAGILTLDGAALLSMSITVAGTKASSSTASQLRSVLDIKSLFPRIITAKDIWSSYDHNYVQYDLANTDVVDQIGLAWVIKNGDHWDYRPASSVLGRAREVNRATRGNLPCEEAPAFKIWVIARRKSMEDAASLVRAIFLRSYPQLPANDCIWLAYQQDKVDFDLDDDLVVHAIGLAGCRLGFRAPPKNILKQARKEKRSDWEYYLWCSDVPIYKEWMQRNEALPILEQSSPAKIRAAITAAQLKRKFEEMTEEDFEANYKAMEKVRRTKRVKT